MTASNDEKPDLDKIVSGLAQDLVKLPPGPLARLRRMATDGPGEGDFWQLAIKHKLRTDSLGMMLVRLMALLTPKGALNGNKRLHASDIAFGAALVAEDYPERRLLRFLALPFEARGEALESMALWLAASGHNGLNCIDLACLLFSPDAKHGRRLAQAYYTPQKASHDEKDDAA